MKLNLTLEDMTKEELVTLFRRHGMLSGARLSYELRSMRASKYQALALKASEETRKALDKAMAIPDGTPGRAERVLALMKDKTAERYFEKAHALLSYREPSIVIE